MVFCARCERKRPVVMIRNGRFIGSRSAARKTSRRAAEAEARSGAGYDLGIRFVD